MVQDMAEEEVTGCIGKKGFSAHISIWYDVAVSRCHVEHVVLLKETHLKIWAIELLLNVQVYCHMVTMMMQLVIFVPFLNSKWAKHKL